jgi:hypothetical protein
MGAYFHAGRAIKIAVVVIVSGVIGLTGILRCSRDNPFDPHSNKYVAGAPPEARFVLDSLFRFIRDSLQITVKYSDTEALGGKTPKVVKLYFNWTGDSNALTDSVTAAPGDSMTVTRYFVTPQNAYAYVQARDNDGVLSVKSRMRLVIDEGKPKITGGPVAVPDTVLTGDTVTLTVSASDTNGTVAAYIWTVLGKDTTTQDSMLRCVFPDTAAGAQKIYVRVRDEDSVFSSRDSVTITVVPRIDTVGPSVTFLSPADSAPVPDPVITVQVRVSDPSGVLFVNVNNNAAARISGTDLNGVYQRLNVTLNSGMNAIAVQAMDKSDSLNQTNATLHVIYQPPDSTPPSIAFSYPESGDTVYQSPVTVTVSVTDQSGVAWVICGSDTMRNPTGSVYTSDVTPVEGTNSLVIRARDTRGNSAVETLVFTYVIRDKTPPFVHITSPLPGARIPADSVTVTVDAQDTGTYTSGIASVTVNGLAATLNLGVYTRTIALNHGSNTIRAVATDGSQAANQAGDSVVVVQNRRPHFMPDTSVKDTGLWVDSAATVTLNAVDPDGDPLIFSFVTNPAKASYGITRMGNAALLTYTPTSAGLDTFRVGVADSIFAEADTILMRIMNTMPDYIPPAIAFVAPLPGDTLRDTINPSPVTVMVSVTDPSGVAWVRCNDSAMSNPSGSTYRRDVMLSEGANSLVIRAQDLAGNDTSRTLTITYLVFRDVTPPVVKITSPQPNQRVPTGSVTVMGYAYDTTGPIKSGIDSVFVNGAPIAYGSGQFSTVVSLAHGWDTIRARAVDSSGNQARDSVMVLRNRPPHFVPDVSVKDTGLVKDSAALITLRSIDEDTDMVNFTFITLPSKDPGAHMVSAGDSTIIAYTPASTGLDTFSVKVSDVWGASDTLRMRVYVRTAGDTIPYFTNDTALIPDTAYVGVPYTVPLAAIDPNALPLTFWLGSPPTPSGVSIDSSTGLVTWTPAAVGTDSFVAFVRNSVYAGSDTLGWAVTVVTPDRPPVVVSGPLHLFVDEGQLLQYAHSAMDPDGDTLRFSLGGTVPVGVSIDSVTGLVSWLPAYNQANTYLLIFVVTERNRTPALSDSVTDTITVNNINRPPLLVNPGNKNVNEGQLLSFFLQASDPDTDQITFSIAGTPPAGASIEYGNDFVWITDESQGGVDTITFVARDNGVPALTDTESIVVSVIDITKPLFGLHTVLDTAYAGITYTSSVHAVDPDGDSMSYAKLSGPDSLAVNATSGAVAWTPSSTDAGKPVAVQVTAADHYGNLDTMTWSIVVVVPDSPPDLQNPGNRTVTEGKTLQFTLVATDQNNDTLRYIISGAAPVGATLDSVTGVFTWTPGYKQAGVYPVLFKVYERDRIPVLSDTASITITVKDTNIAPVFTAPLDSAGYLRYESQTLAITLTAANSDNDSLTYTMIGTASRGWSALSRAGVPPTRFCSSSRTMAFPL